MSISGITSVVTNTGTQINYVKQGSSYIWARPVTITISLPWTKFSSWSITRTSSYEPTASTGSVVASNSSNTLTTDGASLSINGYYGDKYTLTRTAKAGWSGLISNNHEFATDPTFAFADTGGTSIKLPKPVVSVSRTGEYVKATITNNSEYTCIVNAYCGESQYGVYSSGFIGIGAGWKYYAAHGPDTMKTITKEVKPGASLSGSWRTNADGNDCTYGSVSVYLTGTSGTGFTKSDTVTQTSGTRHSVENSGGGVVGGGFTGFGGTLESG